MADQQVWSDDCFRINRARFDDLLYLSDHEVSRGGRVGVEVTTRLLVDEVS